MRKFLANLFVSFLGILITLVLIELSMRAYDAVLTLRYGQSNEEAFLHEYDPIRGWRNKPSSTAYFINKTSGVKVQVHINSHGLRDEELTYAKPENTLRVLLLDASAIAAFEVPDDETVDTVLEEMIDKEIPSQVINGATRAYGTDQSLLFLESDGIRYQPDIIIYVISPLDFDDNLVIHKDGRTYGKSYFELGEDGRLELKGVPVPKTFTPSNHTLMASPLAQDYIDQITGKTLAEASSPEAKPRGGAAVKKWIYDHSMLYRTLSLRIKQSAQFRKIAEASGAVSGHYTETPPALLDQEWKITQKLLERMRNVARDAGARFCLYEFSSGLKLYSPEIQERIRELSESLEVPLIRTAGVFEEAQAGDHPPTFAKDAHWNKTGHRLAARLIFEFLNKKGWLEPAGASSEPPST